jgi:hypothetical protein
MQTVAALFRDRVDAERAINELRRSGFDPQRVSVMARDRERARDVAGDTGADTGTGAATGAGVGALLGGAAGWLAGIGALAIPGIGPIVAAGPIAAALGGAGIGAVAGGLVGALTGWGFSEDEARGYEDRVREGDILLAAEIPDGESTTAAEEVMRRAGGSQVATREWRRRAA